MSGSSSSTDGDSAGVTPLSPPLPSIVFERVVNPFMRWLLSSKYHHLASDELMLVEVTGRKTGQTYTIPVGYEQVDERVYVASQTDRTWWKNLRGGAEVTVWLQGTERLGHATVLEENAVVADHVLGFIDRHGLDAVDRLALSIEGERAPSRSTLAAGLDETVVIEIVLAA